MAIQYKLISTYVDVDLLGGDLLDVILRRGEPLKGDLGTSCLHPWPSSISLFQPT